MRAVARIRWHLVIEIVVFSIISQPSGRGDFHHPRVVEGTLLGIETGVPPKPSQSGLSDGVVISGIDLVYRRPYLHQHAVVVEPSFFGIAPDNIEDLFFGLTRFIQPTFDNLDAV
mgnify:CR=1 FL=1